MRKIKQKWHIQKNKVYEAIKITFLRNLMKNTLK